MNIEQPYEALGAGGFAHVQIIALTVVSLAAGAWLVGSGEAILGVALLLLGGLGGWIAPHLRRGAVRSPGILRVDDDGVSADGRSFAWREIGSLILSAPYGSRAGWFLSLRATSSREGRLGTERLTVTLPAIGSNADALALAAQLRGLAARGGGNGTSIRVGVGMRSTSV